jgi:hypothetical protein
MPSSKPKAKEYMALLEFWEDIKGFEGLYEISSLGRLKSLRREVLVRGVKTVRKEKILNGTISLDKYCEMKLYKNGKKYCFRLARLVALHFLENPNNYQTVDHINRNRSDDRVENLRWANYQMQAQNSSWVENAKHFSVNYCKNIHTPSKWRVEYIIGKKKSRFFLTEKEARDFANTLDRNVLEALRKSKENN